MSNFIEFYLKEQCWQYRIFPAETISEATLFSHIKAAADPDFCPVCGRGAKGSKCSVTFAPLGLLTLTPSELVFSTELPRSLMILYFRSILAW